MPVATSCAESDVATIDSTTPVRLDGTPSAGRFMVEVINRSDVRIAIGHSPSMTFATGHPVDADGGAWDAPAGSGVPVYAIAESGSGKSAHVKQWVAA